MLQRLREKEVADFKKNLGSGTPTRDQLDILENLMLAVKQTKIEARGSVNPITKMLERTALRAYRKRTAQLPPLQ